MADVTEKLPSNIAKDKNGKYVVYKNYNKKKYSGGTHFKLEDAIQSLHELNIKIDNMKIAELAEKDKLPIEYNEDGIAIIPIKNKDARIVAHALVDDDRWHELIKLPLHFGTKDNVVVYVNGKNMFLHSYILKLENESNNITHINKNKLDNRIQNLQEITNSELAHTKKKKEGTHSEYIGVSRKNNKWCATISKNRVTTHIGFYETEIEAAKAYNEKAPEYYGDKAKLNII